MGKIGTRRLLSGIAVAALAAATFTLGGFSFDIVALGITIPVSCSFDSTPPAVSSVVSSS